MDYDFPFSTYGAPEKGWLKLIKGGKPCRPYVQTVLRKVFLTKFIVDKRFWALGITSCFFEGSMYLWIFFKFPALRLTHQLNGKGSDLPFGMIFAALMCAMMLGSMLFTWYSALPAGRWVVPASILLSWTLMVAACCFLLPVLIRDEELTFWCFCIFEICVGIYYPTMGHLKEKFVSDGVRAKVYGMLRLPLNIFVVIGLGLTKDGKQLLLLLEMNRTLIFLQGRDTETICSGFVAAL